MGNQSTKEHSKYRSGHKKNVHWEEAERPHPPGQPLLVPASPGGQHDVVTIRWDPPISDGGSPIIGYIVEHRRTGSPHWVRATPGLVTRGYLSLSGLEPGWRYQFRVSAENAAGRSDPSLVSEPLTVTLAKGVATAPHFTRELQDTVALENEKVELSVRVTGTPTPKISWFKDGLEVFSGRRSRVLTDTEGGSVLTSSLIIHQAALADEGEIKCSATNRAGHAVTKARLKLEAPPSIRLPRQYEDGLLFELGEAIRVKVSIAGRPPPRVTWLHNGEMLRPGARHEMTSTDKGATLRVAEARRSDRGEYQVRAVNQLGEDVAAFLVTVTDRPTPPGKAMVSMTLGRSVTLSWSIPEDDGGCKVGNYIVEYYRIGWDMWLKAATCRQLNTTLGDLIEGSEYKFRVKAENPYGISDPGDESETVFIPDPKRGITNPPQRQPDGSETNDWWNDRKRRRNLGGGSDSELPDDKKLKAEVAPSRKRTPTSTMELEEVSPIPSPVDRSSRATTRGTNKSLSLPRTQSAAPEGSRQQGAPEPPKRRNRSLSRGRYSVSPDPDVNMEDENQLGVVKGRLFGIHLSSDSIRAKRSRENVGIEEVVYTTVVTDEVDLEGQKGRRDSPVGAGEPVYAVPNKVPKIESKTADFNEKVEKYEAKLRDIERRHKELEERENQRQKDIEDERRKEIADRLKEKESKIAEQQNQKEIDEKREELERQEELNNIRDAKINKQPQKKEAPETKLRSMIKGEKIGPPPAEMLSLRSEDGSMTGDSSEFLLVLLPNSRATTEERDDERANAVKAFKDDMEPSVAPPMSLSAPELGAIEPDIPFMRNAVSSTELLHERAMARFYQEVAEEEAEKARKRRMSLQRRVSLERRLSIERKNRERVKGRIDSVDEADEEEIPVNFQRFAGAKPSGSRPSSVVEEAVSTESSIAGDVTEESEVSERVRTSEEREQEEFAALRQRLSQVNPQLKVSKPQEASTDEDIDDEEYLGDEDLEDEEEEEETSEEEYLEEMPEEEPEPEGETYHPRFGVSVDKVKPPSDEAGTPPPVPKHGLPHTGEQIPHDSEPQSGFTFIPKSSTYTTTHENDSVACTLLTKRHSPLRGDVRPKPILKKRGSLRRDRNKTPPSPKSKSPHRKHSEAKSQASGDSKPLSKLMDRFNKQSDPGKSNESVDSIKSEKDKSGFSLFRRKQKDSNLTSDDGKESSVKMRTKLPRSPDTQSPPSMRIEASPEANLGLSAAEAARNKRGISRKESIKDEATKVVISHYSELVREFGTAHKHQNHKYYNIDELKARAEQNGDAPTSQNSILSSTVTSPEPPVPKVETPTETPLLIKTPPVLESRETTRRDSSISRREPTKRDLSTSRRESSLARREPSGTKRESSTARRESSTTRRESSVSRRESSAARREESLARRNESLTLQTLRIRKESDRSVSRSHTSVSSSSVLDDRSPSPEVLVVMKKAEENVKTAASYLTDVGMFCLAVWLYLFESELMAIPILFLLVYRQLKEEMCKRLPTWVVRRLEGKKDHHLENNKH